MGAEDMNSQHLLQNDYSSEISTLRASGKLDDAINKCHEAISDFPDDNFFYKILGDICAQAGRWEEASAAYLENIKRLEKRPKHFRTFIRFYQLFEKKAPEDLVLNYNKCIKEAIDQGQIPAIIADYVTSFLGERLTLDQELLSFLSLTNNDKNYRKVKAQINTWMDNNNLPVLKTLAAYRLQATDHSKSKQNDRFIIHVLERIENYKLALELIRKSQKPYTDLSIICSILRICRRISDYSFAESELSIDDSFISQSDFNIQYELVYYFNGKNDLPSLQKTLKAMSSSGTSSIPIARTLYNFYLSFNMFDEAEKEYEHVQNLERNKKEKRNSNSSNDREAEQLESEQVVWQRLKDLVSEQEHNRQMIALSDLLKGFSHELGQPITNIRYAVQLHKMKMRKGKDSPQDIDRLLETVLDQTQRIGVLLARFRPIVSSKSKKEVFSIKSCIEKVLSDLDYRLKLQGVEYTIGGPADISIYGDPIQFSQVFYNLVLNSMQAIGGNGAIKITISSDRKKDINISFSDNGPGIPEENRHKIFEPFFSTKEPSDENGGEGLGLFIVWNILKMFDGTIRLDDKNKIGAKFLIKLPYRKERFKDESSLNS